MKLYHSSLLSPNSASHSDHVGLPNLLLPLELLVFPASLAKLACRLKTQCTGEQGQLRTLEWFCAPGCDRYTAGLRGSESNYHNFPFFFFVGVNSGDPAVQILHMLLSMQTSLAILLPVLPSPLLLHTTHSHFIVTISKEATSTVFAISPWSSPSKQL